MVRWTGDMSMFGWQLMALKSAEIAGAKKDINRLITALQTALSPDLAEGATGV